MANNQYSIKVKLMIDIGTKLKEYIALKEQRDELDAKLNNLKFDIDMAISDDYIEIENVGSFKRGKSSVRKSLDRKTVEKLMPTDLLPQCYKETQVKGSVTIMSWDAMQRQKQYLENTQ